ncbi:MAG: hypothetical protein JNM84_26560 [Planctomycetes bacterium]|nr:hypothetical protein [Planctomycetota bacterium]
MKRSAPWILRTLRIGLAVGAAALAFALLFGPRLQDAAASRGNAGVASTAEDLRVAGTDAAMARLGRLRDGERALRALRAANTSAARTAADTLRRSAAEVESARRARPAVTLAPPPPGARFLPPVQLLSASPSGRADRVDVALSWSAEDPNLPALEFEVWRWTATTEPTLVASKLIAPRYVDAGLAPGPIEIGYSVFAVTGDGSGSRSEGRAVQVELPALHVLALLEEQRADRNEPPPATPGASEPPPGNPTSARLEVRRTEDGRTEVVEVSPGQAIGQACATGLEVVALRWVEVVRPIRYREPVFRSDGTLEPGEGGAQTKFFVLEERVWLPAVEVRDGWGRTLQILPPAEVPRAR